MMDLKHLPNQERDEVVKLFLRRHWIDLLKALLFSLALFAVPVVVTFVLDITDTNFGNSEFWQALGAVLLSCYLLIAAVITMAEITDYFLDVWIVTSERIINIEQKGLFSRTVSELRLNQIQDITSEMKGFLETFLTYGDVYIQTAAERERFQFKNINNPDDVKLEIARLVDECKRRHHHPPVESSEALINS